MAEPGTRGLLVDFGGVLTTDVRESFDRFCEVEELERGSVLELFRGDGEALALLRSLERRGGRDDRDPPPRPRADDRGAHPPAGRQPPRR